MCCFEKSRQNQEITFTFCFCCSVAKLCPTLCDPMDNSMPGFPVLHYLLKFAQTHIHWVRDAIQPSHLSPLLLLPLIFPSIRVFPSESALHQVADVFKLQHPWIFRVDFLWIDSFDLLAVQGTLMSLFQHHSSKASILWCLAFFMVHLSHLYMLSFYEYEELSSFFLFF